MVTDITPPDVKKKLEGDESIIYLDVRTVPEFTAGHIAGAWNVPVAIVDLETAEMRANDEFLRVVEAAIPKDANVIVGCRSGTRSSRAAQIMLDAGYKHLSNMVGGLVGKKDAAGNVLQQGWEKLGYPTIKGGGGDVSYKSLEARKDP